MTRCTFSLSLLSEYTHTRDYQALSENLCTDTSNCLFSVFCNKKTGYYCNLFLEIYKLPWGTIVICNFQSHTREQQDSDTPWKFLLWVAARAVLLTVCCQGNVTLSSSLHDSHSKDVLLYYAWIVNVNMPAVSFQSYMVLQVNIMAKHM